MTLYTPRVLASSVLTTGLTTVLFTPPVSGSVLTQIVLANKSAEDQTVTLTWNNGASDITLAGGVLVPANTTVVIDLRVPLQGAGNVVKGGASAAAAVDVTLSGLEITEV